MFSLQDAFKDRSVLLLKRNPLYHPSSAFNSLAIRQIRSGASSPGPLTHPERGNEKEEEEDEDRIIDNRFMKEQGARKEKIRYSVQKIL